MVSMPSQLYRVLTSYARILECPLAGMTGLALSYALTVNNILVFAVQNQCTSANLIVSVERIRQYMGIPSKGVPVREAKHSGSLETWPERGEVVFDNLQVRELITGSAKQKFECQSCKRKLPF